MTEGTVRARFRRPLPDRVEAFTAAHPGITVAAPYATRSGLWEVSDGTGTAQWDNGFTMMDNLERRYPCDDSGN